MRDETNTNPLGVTGTPTLVDGALTVDPDQALTFNGPTTYASAVDSASLSITGSLSIELFARFTSFPGSAQNIVAKGSSYGVSIDSTGHVSFFLVNGAASVAITANAALETNRWYHIVCVYNGEYAGAEQFGKSTLGSTFTQVDDDNGNNKAVSRFTLLETALLRNVSISLQYRDEIWPVEMCAVVYADTAGSPGTLVTSSAVQLLNPPTPQWRTATWVSFPLTPAVVPAGDYHLGYISDTVAGIPKAPLVIGCETSGGATFKRPDGVSGPSSPFGSTVVSTSDMLAAYCAYTATSRTGHEGKALMYIDGALNVSAPYSGGIADTSSALDVCAALNAEVDEVSIWDRALSDAQVATHYTAH